MNIKDSICVLGGAMTGVFLGFGISYKMLRDQSAHFKQLQDEQNQQAERTNVVYARLEELMNFLKRVEDNSVDRSRESKLQYNTSLKPMEHQLKILEMKCVSLEQIQSEVHMTSQKIERQTDEIEKLKENLKSVMKRTEANYKYLKDNQDQHAEQKRIIETTPEQIMISLKILEDKLVERTRELQLQYNSSLQPLEHQLKLLTEMSVSLEQIKCKVHTTSEKINIHTEEIENIKEKMKSNMNSTEGLHDLEEDTPAAKYDKDILILHAEIDKSEAENCKMFLLDHMGIENLQVAVQDDILIPGSNLLPELGKILDTCRLVFIYETENLKSDRFANFEQEMHIIQSLNENNKTGRIVPFVVDEGTTSVITSPFINLKYIKDINDRRFSTFKRRFENLVKSWKEKLP